MRNSNGSEMQTDALALMGPHKAASIHPSRTHTKSREPSIGSLAARTAGGARNNLRLGHTSLASIVQRMRQAINARIVEVLCQEASDVEREQARVEIALLIKLHRGFGTPMHHAQEDVVLCDTLVEFAESVPAILADLQSGGAPRLRRLLEFNRQLLSELCALGGKSAAFKPRIEQARALINTSGDSSQYIPAAQEAVDIYAHLCCELDRHCPRAKANLFDELAHR